MGYPVDVEAELDKAEDRLCNIRISGEKWEYFRRLIEEINTAYLAGMEGAGGYPWDVAANLSAEMDRLGGFGATERRLVSSWMERINEAHRNGRVNARRTAEGKERVQLPQEEEIAFGALEFVDPKSGLTVRAIKDPRELEYYLTKYVRDGKPFSFKVPGVERIATVYVKEVSLTKSAPSAAHDTTTL